MFGLIPSGIRVVTVFAGVMSLQACQMEHAADRREHRRRASHSPCAPCVLSGAVSAVAKHHQHDHVRDA
jgi:hypothetical protein